MRSEHKMSSFDLTYCFYPLDLTLTLGNLFISILNKQSDMSHTIRLRIWIAILCILPTFLFAQVQAQVDLPTVSVPGGKYDTGFPLSIMTLTPNAKLYFTLDGSEPSESTTLYTTPISISKNTTLRVKGFLAGMTPSGTTTHTYFLNVAHTFPIVALSFKKSDFFNETTGIYVKYENGLEVPTNIEFFEPSAKIAAFNQMAGVEIQGLTSARLPQKSLEIKASGKYSALPYKVFPDQPFTSFKRLVLRNSGQDWGVTLFRDEMVTSLGSKLTDLNGIVRALDLSMQDFRPSVVYLNGEYWGIHGIRERMNKYYVEQHFNLKSADYDMVENWGDVSNNGDSLSFFAFYNALPNRNFADNAAFEQLKTELDVSNFLDYNVFNVFIDDTDWPSNNVRCFKTKTNGKWRFISFDHDFSFGLFQLNGGWNTGDATPNSLARLFNATTFNWPNSLKSTLLFRKCMENATFKRDFINRMADMMNTVFKPTRISQKIDDFKTQYQPEMARHIARWGTPYSTIWSENIEKMRNFGNVRANEITKHVRQQFPEVTGTASVTVSAVPANGGSVNFSTLNLTTAVMPFTGTYFSGIDIPVTAVPAAGYVFRGWSDASLGASPTIKVRLAANLNLTAIFELVSGNACAVDKTSPILQNCPPNTTLTTSQNCATTTWTPPTVTDNCTPTPSVWSNYPSGFCFPLGATTVVYTAIDNASNVSTCSFSVQVNRQTTSGGVCKKYKVGDVNNFCGCPTEQFMPYAVLIENNTSCLGGRLTAQIVDFQQNADGTATLTGTFRDINWTPILINIQLSGGTIIPPSGAPFLTSCMQAQPIAATNGWLYYTQMTGTYKFGNNAPLPIILNGAPFQVGIGAGQQRVSVLGASAKCLIGGSAKAQFNIFLTNEQTVTCTGTGNTCDTDTQPPTWANCPQNIALTTTKSCEIATWSAPTATDNCGVVATINPSLQSGGCFSVGTTTVVYTATDAKNNRGTCSFNINVQGTVAGTTDIELSMTSNLSSYTKFTYLNVQITAKNLGTTPFTNARIKFPYPQGTVNGGNPTPSVGTWNFYCGNTECYEWQIPSLPVGATATIIFPLFVLNPATAINAVASLLASTPTDVNTANNQAQLSIVQKAAPVAAIVQKTHQYLPIVVQKISPNPTTEGAIIVDLESMSDSKGTFEFFNALGKILKTETQDLKKGENKLFFDVQDLEAGIYFIVPKTQIGKRVPTKFVKM